MTEQSAEYRAQAERLKAGHNHGMMPVTQDRRQHLLTLRRNLLSTLTLIERELGCESSVKSRPEKQAGK